MSPIQTFFSQAAAFHINAGILLLIYLAAINVIAFWTMGHDKKKARHGEWRTPESVLFLQAIIGGSIGSILGMQVFRHKTRKLKFRIGMPAILICQLLLVLLLIIFSSQIVFL